MKEKSVVGKYLYVTLDSSDGSDYRGIVVEDVEADYKEIQRFFSGDFQTDFSSYESWSGAHIERHQSVEIYESDVLREKIRSKRA